MSDDLQKRAKRVLDAIADLPEAERQAVLGRECEGDAELEKEVRSLLAFWSAPTVDWVSSGPERPADAHRPTRMIGPYRVIRELGRGGMGVVYLAKRKGDQFRRTVALKVLKRGMDSEDVLRRFELERQVLAAMNHPGIARLYEAGETEDGTPYFVMEYVEGTDIMTYCDTHRLHIAERLAIFRKVCEAVHYAHQNLVVHRDLKPSNIVMTEDGQPKLLDFGIAKIINPQFNLVEGDPTAPELRVMTPEYASPEQVRGDTITTASDVYSLGVLLYQIVSGHPPYRIRTRVRDELVRIICEMEPERPSTAVATVEEFATSADGTGGTTTITPDSVGVARDSRPQHLRRALAGDIDNMVMKAIRKEPQRRYTSAQQFAEDIGRYFDGMPVIARPDTLWYRASKFVKRNRAGVAAAAVIVLLLVGGIIGVSWQREVAVAARKEAVAQKEEAEAARERESAALAETEAARAREQSLREEVEIAQRATRSALARAQEVQQDSLEIGGAFATIARTIAKLPGALQIRRDIAETYLQLLTQISDRSDLDQDLRTELADANAILGALNDIRNPTYGDSAIALSHYKIALEIHRGLVAEYPGDMDLLRKATLSHLNVATQLRRQGKTAEALDVIQKALILAESLQESQPDDPEAKRTLSAVLLTIGDCHVKADDVERAMPFFERSLELREALLAEHRDGDPAAHVQALRDMGVICGRLGVHLRQLDRADDARRYLERNISIREALADGADEANAHRFKRDLVTARVLFADFERKEGNLAAARAGLEQAIDETTELAAADPEDARLRRDLRLYRDVAAWTCVDLEDWPAAAAHFEARLRMDDPHDPAVLSGLAFAYHKAGRAEDAIAAAREALGLLEGRTDEASVEMRRDLEANLDEFLGR